MADRIDFVNNYTDLSTDKGFQFEFECNRCRSGYRTKFVPSVTGTVSGVVDAASSLFGGIFSSASNIAGRVHDAAWERGHDDNFQKAMQEIRPEFIQCPRCQNWVCRQKCWNEKKGLCKECAPDMGVEMAAAQASRSVEEVWRHAAMSAEDKKLSEANWRETINATCPECETPMATNAKFCPNCGAKVKREEHCTECGAIIQPGAKFCADCGKKVGS